MRYYEVYFPGDSTAMVAANVRDLHHRTPLGLPDGTRVYRVITACDGTLADYAEVPVVDGRVRIRGRGKQRPKAIGGRF